MEVGIRSAPGVVNPAAPGRTDAAGAVRASAPTALAPAFTVAPSAPGEPVQTELSDEARRLQAAADVAQRTIERNLETDPATRQIVLKLRDARTGAVIRQVPDEQSLQLQAHIRALFADKAEAKRSTFDIVA